MAQKIDDSIPAPGLVDPSFNDFLNVRRNFNDFTFSPVTNEDILRIINSFQNKASHISTYSVIAIKAISNLISPILRHIVNKSLSEGHFPKFCKIARVVPVFKSGLSSSLGNYRPISILPIFSKIFEKVVHKQLSDYLLLNNILNPNQFGFRKNRSTTDAIIDMTQYIYDNLDCGETVISLFLDLSKAFDTVNHVTLLHKLQSYGICDIALDWFRSYLSGRLQYVSLDGYNSQVHPWIVEFPRVQFWGLSFPYIYKRFPKLLKFFQIHAFC